MDKKETKEVGVFDQIKGLKTLDPNALADFKREMTEEVIPKIIQDVDKRRMLAAESRQRQLETPSSQKPDSPQ